MVSKNKNEQKILVVFGNGSVSASDTRELEAQSIYYASLLCDFVLERIVQLLANEV